MGGDLPSAPPPRKEPGRGPSSRQLLRGALWVIIIVIVLGFIVANSKRVSVSFLGFEWRMPLFGLILLTLAVGFIAGALLWGPLRRRYLSRGRPS
jgi:uncharacterized integral membrane protein